MEEALNKSLDDLIAEQRTKKPKQQTRSKPESGRGGSGAARSRPGGSVGRREREAKPVNLSITVRGGGVSKARGGGRGGGGGGGGRGGRDPVADRQSAEQRRAALEGSAKWTHDRFDGGRGDGSRRRDPRQPSRLGTKIYISNLDWSVSEDDIKELFETCGPLVKHQIHFDRSGRSEGTAEVIFSSKADAERAMKRYNNVQLDGKPMSLELIDQAGANGGGAGGRVLSSGLKVTGGGGGGSGALTVTRSFQQATSGLVAEARQPRGRGNIRSRVDYMQE